MSRNVYSNARSLSAIATLAGSVLCLGAPAQAYDLSSCNQLLPTSAVQRFSVDGGGADFGDDAHLGGHPFGDAVICWSPAGRVAVIGKLYADDLCLPFRPCDPLTATVKIRFQRTNGRWTGVTTRTKLTQGNLASLEVKKKSPLGSFKNVNIRLFTFQTTDLGPTGDVLVAERNFQP
jgi:hypothetical protein